MPYILLCAAALILCLSASRFPPLWLRAWSYLTTGGAITLGDLLVNATLMMYRYEPGLLSHRLPDNYLGVLIAECIFVPAYYAALSLTPPRWRFLAYLLGVVPILLIELLFLQLGVYFHRTWTMWHSIILFGLYSCAAAYAANSFERRRYTPIHRFLVTAGTMYYIMNLWALIPYGILRLAVIRLHLFAAAELDYVISSVLLHAIPFTLMGIIGTWFGVTRRPFWLAAMGLGFALWLAVLRATGVWTSKPPWNPWLSGLTAVLSWAVLGQIDRWFAAAAPPPIPRWEPPET